MALELLAGPGCNDLKMGYVADQLGPEDVVISAGSLFKALTGSNAVPSSNSAALRMALGLRTTAIRNARTNELSGFVLTSNGARRDLDRLMTEAGASRVTVLKMSEAQACTAVAKLVTGDRRAACEEGIKRRWFGRYNPGPDDLEVSLND